MYRKENLKELLEKAHYINYDISDKCVLLRSCLNVSIDDEGNIIDDTRLREALPVIRDIASKAKKLVIAGHMGRPEPKRLNHYHKYNFTPEEKKFSLQKVGEWLQSELSDITRNDIPVHIRLLPDTQDAAGHVEITNASEIILLENIRFSVGEEAKDEAQRHIFAAELAELADIYINDAFPDYRSSVSTYEIAKILPSYLGTSFYNEVKYLCEFSDPERPFIAVLGGAKLSEKLEALRALLDIADKVIIGGAMAYTLLKAQGIPVGNSLVEEDKLQSALEMVTNYPEKIVLPIDHKVGKAFVEEQEMEMTTGREIPDEMMALDIGSKTLELYTSILEGAASVLLNGPMGVFEWDEASQGTKSVLSAIVANEKAFTLAGGGDSITAINNFEITGFDHISTGGGAMLAFIAYEEFPTLDVILENMGIRS